MKPRKRPEPAAPMQAISEERCMVPLDQEPLRQGAMAECKREMARLELGQARWKRYEQEDKPAFARWMAATFGSLLSRLRENQSLIRAQKSLIREVETELQSGRARSHRTAYAAVMKRRANPPPAPEEGGPRFAEDAGIGQKELFFRFLREVLGLDPEAVDDPLLETMYADFKAKGSAMAGEPEPAAPGVSRVKELYRLLVRRLHPDTRADASVEVSALWHEVQEAYAGGNVERLEMLVALTGIQSESPDEETSLFQMKAVVANLRASIEAVRRSLHAARREPSWNFTRAPDRSALRARLQREFERELASQKQQMRTMEVTIGRWSLPPKAKRPKARPAPQQG